MTSERSGDDRRGSRPPARRKVPQSVSELIARLEDLAQAPKRPLPAALLRLFAAKRAMPTSERERETLRDLLGPLDPSWAVRAAIVASGAPERLVESSATLGTLLARDARAETGYPVDGEAAQLVAWASAVAATSDRGRTMPAVALAALWPDRARDGVASAVARIILGTSIRPSGGRAALGPPDVAMRGLLDLAKGTRALSAHRWLLVPADAEVMRLGAELADQRNRAAALGRRTGSLERESHELSERLAEALAALENAEASRRAAEAAAAAAEERRIREVRETAGTAMHQRIAMARDYAGDVSRLAEDIGSYLDRPNPNVAGALKRAREIEALARELEKEG